MEILSDTTFKGNLNVLGTSNFGKDVKFDSSINVMGCVCGSEFISTGRITGFDYSFLSVAGKRIDWAKYGQEENGIVYSGASEFHFHTNTFGAKVELKNACLCFGHEPNHGNNFIGLTTTDGNHYNLLFQNKSGTIALTSDIKVVPEVKIGYCSGVNEDVPTDCTLFKVDIGQTVKSVISATIEKHYGTASGCTLIDGCFWENTDIDIFQSTKHPNSTFFIRKAAGAMAMEVGIMYSLKVVYI